MTTTTHSKVFLILGGICTGADVRETLAHLCGDTSPGSMLKVKTAEEKIPTQTSIPISRNARISRRMYEEKPAIVVRAEKSIGTLSS